MNWRTHVHVASLLWRKNNYINIVDAWIPENTRTFSLVYGHRISKNYNLSECILQHSNKIILTILQELKTTSCTQHLMHSITV